MIRITDLALLIAGHHWTEETYEEAVQRVLNEHLKGPDERKAHVYASVVEATNAESRVSAIEAALSKALHGWPHG